MKMDKIKSAIGQLIDGYLELHRTGYGMVNVNTVLEDLENLAAIIDSEEDEKGINVEKGLLDTRKRYADREAGIKAHASTYSFNIPSELYPQLTAEQQKLWRKEIEQAVISGGEFGIEIAQDNRYEEMDKEE